uniref:Uncharacterized protein n=1 Tax=Physcomitrium patens TaxID=3218 RepID=A0A2K1IRS5_PHYPA|nr:hypothetical protein PHYPA_026092 [Physcomitrium patens]
MCGEAVSFWHHSLVVLLRSVQRCHNGCQLPFVFFCHSRRCRWLECSIERIAWKVVVEAKWSTYGNA